MEEAKLELSRDTFSLISNLEYFDQWPQENRYHFYYEDLLENPRGEITKLLEFVKEPPTQIDSFIENISVHKENCLTYYDRAQGSISKGNAAIYHSKKLPKGKLKELNEEVKNLNRDIWEKYLSRYEID